MARYAAPPTASPRPSASSLVITTPGPATTGRWCANRNLSATVRSTGRGVRAIGHCRALLGCRVAATPSRWGPAPRPLETVPPPLVARGASGERRDRVAGYRDRRARRRRPRARRTYGCGAARRARRPGLGLGRRRRGTGRGGRRPGDGRPAGLPHARGAGSRRPAPVDPAAGLRRRPARARRRGPYAPVRGARPGRRRAHPAGGRGGRCAGRAADQRERVAAPRLGSGHRGRAHRPPRPGRRVAAGGAPVRRPQRGLFAAVACRSRRDADPHARGRASTRCCAARTTRPSPRRGCSGPSAPTWSACRRCPR